MKKHLLLILLAFALYMDSSAQYVTIPDVTFATWLRNNGFSTCMNGNTLDTTCSTVLAAHGLYLGSVDINFQTIHDLTGIQYFKNLDTLEASSDYISIIPSLPAGITYLNLNSNNLSTLPALPTGLTLLSCNLNVLTALPALPNTLQTLYCQFNQISTLPALPNGLVSLMCGKNLLRSLPALPGSLTGLVCNWNPLYTLPALPASLQGLTCEADSLTGLPALPAKLTYLECSYNQITSLPVLPDTMQTLHCMYNQLTALPTIPAGLYGLRVDYNQLPAIGTLPVGLNTLTCSYNNITSIPGFPSSLVYIDISHNQLSSLPTLPPSNWNEYNEVTPTRGLQLNCAYNTLTSIPALPDSINFLVCTGNPNLTCLPPFKYITTVLDFDSTGITCLPGYGTVDSSRPALNTVPLCGPGNPGGCAVNWNISGTVFYDANADCNYSAPDTGLNRIKLMLYNNGVLQQQTYTGADGLYSFQAANYNSYNVVVDTNNLPFAFNATCPDTGSLPVTLSASDSFSINNNFAFVCYPTGFDLGVNSIGYNYSLWPRPGATLPVNIVAGDLSALYGAHCASGVSGQVQIIYGGMATYAGPQPGALTPNVNGSTLTYTVADFGQLNPLTAFNIYMQMDNGQSAVGTPVCINVSVTPTAGDYNVSNNALDYCFAIVDAIDPNEKEVYPTVVTQPGQWLTYTVRFQNTGNAPAVNVVAKDTLSTNLDVTTFTLLNNSANALTQLNGNVATFTWANTNLPAVAAGDSASRGYVQFKIKTISNFTTADVVNNTAYIYFDGNTPVATNTVTDTFTTPTGIKTYAANAGIKVTAFPNPFNDITYIDISGLGVTDKYDFELYDVTGRLQLSIPSGTGNHFRLERGKLAAGVYTYRLMTGAGEATAFGKLVVQ